MSLALAAELASRSDLGLVQFMNCSPELLSAFQFRVTVVRTRRLLSVVLPCFLQLDFMCHGFAEFSHDHVLTHRQLLR